MQLVDRARGYACAFKLDIDSYNWGAIMPQFTLCYTTAPVRNGLETVGVLEQTDAQITRKIDVFAIARNAAIGNTHNQFALNNAF